MKTNNLENQIREKLNSREIKPTEMAWDRLDAMLTVAEEKKSKKGFSWLFIAACFLGMLTVGTLIYKLNTNEIKIENEVVNEQKKSNSNDNLNSYDSSNELIINEDVEIPVDKKQQIVLQSSQNNKIENKNLQSKNQNLNNKTIINQKTTEKNEIEKLNQSDEVVVQIENKILQNKEIVASNSNVDVSSEALLASVDKARKSVKQSKVTVNASSLLSQINGEINTDYRETRFQKLKRNFETVKVAVANRNNLKEVQ